MIRKVIIRNIKKFGQQEFEIPKHLVIAGLNNSGKTTVLQAVAAWSEIAVQWLDQYPNPAKGPDGNYPNIDISIEYFYSIPLADFDHLWRDKHVKLPASVWLDTDQWKIGFEFLHKGKKLVTARPASDVEENDLKALKNAPFTPVYISPFSDLSKREVDIGRIAVQEQLASARGSSVLRNLLVAVNQNPKKWKKLQEVIRSFFGYELSPTSVSPKNILALYQHSKHDHQYDLNSAASGFLQVLTVYAILLHKDVSVVLIDEPDAHLHILLQEKIYRDLRDYARENETQLIVATHSEQIINIADEEALRILTSAGELRKANKQEIKKTLRLENTEIALAITEPGILYVEGKTDIDILREWARILGHPLLAFLEKPFWRATAEEGGKKGFPLSHFKSMRLVVPDFRGVELRDGDQGERGGSPTDGIKSLCWQRYEIENYLIHPQTISRFVEKNRGTNAALAVDNYMKKQLLPQAVYEDPLKTDFLQDPKGKKLLSNLMQEAGIDIKESDYYQIAAEMTEDEIHPEVREILGAIAKHFNIHSGTE
ncbi:MAG: AAA family ATPase [Gammaproteobacteria bacterium]|nr:AAA family ATPase [Gammaproteobacteria bacterium]